MIFVNSDEQIAEFESHMQQYLQTRESFITVDTEFIRENSATPVLCLIQIATQQKIYLIDPLAVSLKFLDKYFSNSTLIKVFHSAQQDIELLSLNGLNLNRIYDTQLYEMLLSTTENISYQAIVAHYLNKKIYKDYGLSKWAQRPLSHQQLKYAKNDVSYLRDVFIKQQHLLKTLKRDHWLDNEAFIPYENDNSSLEKSINEENLPVLHSLLNQRKQIAERLQTSENFISDDLIKAICKKGTDASK